MKPKISSRIEHRCGTEVLKSTGSGEEKLTVVWQRLEEENQEFFEVYHIRLALKEQIQQFNELLKQQANMEKIQNTRVTPMPVSNESCEAQCKFMVLWNHVKYFIFDFKTASACCLPS